MIPNWYLLSRIALFPVLKNLLPIVCLILCAEDAVAQDTAAIVRHRVLPEQIDLIDVGRHLFLRHPKIRSDSVAKTADKVYWSLLPSVEYTLQTAFAVNLTGNAAFYTGDGAENISNIYLNLTYTQKHQFVIPLDVNIWTRGNKYNIISDWRYAKFPQDTYGLGGLTQEDNGYLIDFSYVRFYQTILKTVAPNLYAGLGYDLDYYWNVHEVGLPPGKVTDFQRYGLHPISTSSGVTFNLLYDSRHNAINPEPGNYLNIVYRPNFTFLGSDSNWQTLLIDGRKYIHLPGNGKNILAFWTFDWLTLHGDPPYLLLPSTASDTYVNMGRGYIQGRFRSKNVLYLESEYRFGILSNGLLGGVVFANAQSYTEPSSGRFEAVSPGWGAGIRIKLNKFSHTNIALDYGFGLHGSKGIFANLGEVF
jgi:outer membrane protein assembly factor BamA